MAVKLSENPVDMHSTSHMVRVYLFLADATLDTPCIVRDSICSCSALFSSLKGIFWYHLLAFLSFCFSVISVRIVLIVNRDPIRLHSRNGTCGE